MRKGGGLLNDVISNEPDLPQCHPTVGVVGYERVCEPPELVFDEEP